MSYPQFSRMPPMHNPMQMSPQPGQHNRNPFPTFQQQAMPYLNHPQTHHRLVEPQPPAAAGVSSTTMPAHPGTIVIQPVSESDQEPAVKQRRFAPVQGRLRGKFTEPFAIM